MTSTALHEGPNRRARPVILWGFSKRDFPYFFDYFVRVNLDPRALVAPTEPDVAPLLPVLTPEHLSSDDFRDIPIVLAPGLGYEGFEACLAQLAAQGSTSSRRIVHACCALNELDYDLTGRVHTVGFPGMGNVLLQSMIYRLMERMPNPYPGIMPTPQLGILVPDHQQILAELLRARLRVPEKATGSFLPLTEARIFLRFDCDDGRYIDLYGIHNPHWHTARIITGHTLPTVAFSRRWIGGGGKLVVQMRNPLDAIVSCAAKLIRPPSRILGDLDWFRRMVRLLTHYLQKVQDLPEEKVILRYEDILDAPLTYGLQIAHALDANADVEYLAQVWGEIGLKDLVVQQAFHRTQKHFFRPGTGKWREYLDTRHAHIVEEEGLVAQMGDFGYAFAHDQFRPPADGTTSGAELSADETASVQVRDFPYFLFDVPPFFSCDGIVQGKLPLSGMKFVTNDTGFAEALRLLDADSLPLYAASGSPLQ